MKEERQLLHGHQLGIKRPSTTANINKILSLPHFALANLLQWDKYHNHGKGNSNQMPQPNRHDNLGSETMTNLGHIIYSKTLSQTLLSENPSRREEGRGLQW